MDHRANNQPSTRDVLLFMCCVAMCIPGNQAYCSSYGPENCKFQTERRASPHDIRPTFCSWVSDGFKLILRDIGVFVQLDYRRTEGNLTSRMECGKTHWTSSCLKFLYYFDQNGTIDLSVSVKYDSYSRAKPPIWTMSSGGVKWNDAVVPIRTNGNFELVFKAKRRSAGAGSDFTSSDSVYIDAVEYDQDGRECQLFPPIAKPTQSPTTTIATLTTPVLMVSTIATLTTPVSMVSTTSKTEGEKEEKEHSNADVITGVAVAVGVAVIAFTVVLVLCLVFRRRRKSRPRNESVSKTPASPSWRPRDASAAGGFVEGESENDENGAEAIRSGQRSENSALLAGEARTSGEPPYHDYYSAADCHHPTKTSGEPSASHSSAPSQPARVDQPSRFHPARACRPPPDELSPQHLGHLSNGYETVVEVGRERGALYQEDQGDATDCYNRLDLGGGTARGAAAGGGSEGAGLWTESVYNHLDDGDGETYSGLDQGTTKRTLVIDWDYAHLQ